MKLAAGHSVSNMFSSHIPPPTTSHVYIFIMYRHENDGVSTSL